MCPNPFLGVVQRHFHRPPSRKQLRTPFNTLSEGLLGTAMSNYQIGAFEALQWAWHMLREYRDQPEGVYEGRKAIQDVLMNMGKGDQVDFQEQLQNSAVPI